MTNLATCLGLSLYRFCQCAFYGPATLQSIVQRSKFDANFGRPSGKAHCLAVEFNHLNVGARWVSQGELYSPAVLQAGTQRRMAYSNLLSPIWDTLRYPIERQQANAGSIKGLLFWRCPTAIFRGIAFRVIDSINAVRRGWSQPHVGVEVLKRKPSVAYYLAISSIGWKGFRVRVIASAFHALPCIVFWCVAHAVLALAAWNATAATVLSQHDSIDRFLCSALAPTQPVGYFRWVRNVLCNYGPFTESLPSQVFEARVPTSRIGCSHDVVPLKQVVVRTASQLQLIGCSHFSTPAIGGQI